VTGAFRNLRGGEGLGGGALALLTISRE